MNATPHPLDKLITEARDKLARAERDLNNARVELDALERARAAVGEVAAPARRRNGRQQPAARRKRSLSKGWQEVLRAIGRQGESDLDRILAFCGEAGLSVERDTLRSQMFNYVKRGYLVRPREGVFRLTAEGAKIANVPLGAGDDDAPPHEGEAP
ncbi:MAG: hypothetical protein ACREE1_09100 [Stellaceae bacterium]